MRSQRVRHNWGTFTFTLTIWTFVGKVMSPLFNTLSRFVIDFLSRGKRLLIFMAVATLSSDFGALENKIFHCFHCFPIYMPWSHGIGWHDLSFLNVELQASLFTLLFHFSSRGSLVLHFLPWVVSSAYLRLLTFLPAILIPACASSSPAFLMMYSAYK